MNDLAAVKQVSRLDDISTILGKALAHLTQVHARSTELADRVMGANPPEPTPKAGGIIAAAGAINHLQIQAEEVSRMVQQLEREIARIEGL